MCQYVSPMRLQVICANRDTAIALRSLAKAVKADSRFKISAGLYPDYSGAGRFRVDIKINRLGLMDGIEAMASIKSWVANRRIGTVHRGDNEHPLVNDTTA